MRKLTLALLVAFSLLPSACPCLSAAETAATPAIPPAGEILKNLRKGHPRLLATDADFDRIKTAAASDAKLKAWKKALTEQGRKLFDAPPSTYEIPDGLRLLATSRRVMNRVYTLAMLYRLDGDKTYLERAWKELEAAAAFPDWNPKHFLDTAEMTHAFAIAYDWLYPVWNDEQKQLLSRAMIEKGLEPALQVYRSGRGWPKARHNWNQVCNGGIGMGALALAEEKPAMAGEVLKFALESLPLAMTEFAPDGAWNEGPGYWNYATIYNVVFLAGLESALGTDFGLSKIPGFGETGWYPLYVTGPLDRTFNYADGGDSAIRGAQIFWLARKFNQNPLAWYQQGLRSPSALDLLWYVADARGPKAAELPLDRYFRAAEVAVFRSAWEDRDAIFVGFKAGDNKANHSHLDIGCFVMDALGERWAVDLGADDYNLPAYFGNKRWTYYRLRAEGQNTLLINPGEGPDQDPRAATRITRFVSSKDRAFAVADITAAYGKEASKASRGIALLDRRAVLVQDEIKAGQPTHAWWFMHTAAKISITDQGRTATLQQNGKSLRARLLSPEGASFQDMAAEPLPSSPHPPKQGNNGKFRKLAVELSGVTDARIAILLEPVTGAAPAQPPALQPLEEWR